MHRVSRRACAAPRCRIEPYLDQAQPGRWASSSRYRRAEGRKTRARTGGGQRTGEKKKTNRRRRLAPLRACGPRGADRGKTGRRTALVTCQPPRGRGSAPFRRHGRQHPPARSRQGCCPGPRVCGLGRPAFLITLPPRWAQGKGSPCTHSPTATAASAVRRSPPGPAMT
jgi:hypothetical protein